ncbi:MAG: hypothetical protein ACM3JB_20590, partial [Acidobacteriaceae bacterium]
MSDYSQRKSAGHECPQPPEHPAPQPNPPGDKCDDLPKTKEPDYTEPEACPQPCDCPSKPPSTSDSKCLQDLIDDQAGKITAAERAKTFKADLEAFLTKAKAAAQEYNAAKYQKLLKQWQE